MRNGEVVMVKKSNLGEQSPACLTLAKRNLAIDKLFYSIREAAIAVGVQMKDIERVIEEGRLTVYRTPGGHRKIPKKSLENFSG